MTFMSRPPRHDGYYDNAGQWKRTKFCFRSCGARCTCGPPLGEWYSAEHDQRIECRNCGAQRCECPKFNGAVRGLACCPECDHRAPASSHNRGKVT